MKYIMVTDFDKHWDRIDKNFTSYSTNMIRQRVKKERYVSGTNTVFIKKAKYSDIVERAWIGKVWDIQVLPGKIFFRVELEKDIECPSAYSAWGNGWYFELDK
jgi:hypothetical protein